jgi:hypothetical protein
MLLMTDYMIENLTASKLFYKGVDTRVIILGKMTVVEQPSGTISVFDSVGRQTTYFRWRDNALKCIDGRDCHDYRLAALVFVDEHLGGTL